MKVPRDISGDDLIARLRLLGYMPTRQTGSHVRLTCVEPRQHHVTIPRGGALRLGTLVAILADVSAAHGLSRDEVLRRLFP